MIGYGMVSLAASGTGLVPLGLGAAALWASNTACPWDPNQSSGASGPTTGHCVEVSDEGGDVFSRAVGTSTWNGILGGCEARSISVTQPDGPGNYNYELTILKLDGTIVTSGGSSDVPVEYKIEPCAGGSCLRAGSSAFPPIPDTTYTDPDTGCELNVQFLGIASDQSGLPAPVFQIEPILPPASTRSSGGIISGCNFEPVIYMGPPGGGGGGDGPTVIPAPPVPPANDPYWWQELISAAIGGLVGVAIDNALDALFGVKYANGSRTITAACNYKADGTPEEFSVTYPQENYQSRVITSLDAIVAFQQQILKWRTPVCFGNHNSGEQYTLTWVSDELNAQGNALVKEMKYWDQTAKTHEEHFLHWKDFSWQAGPVMVGVAGSVLGKMQVWAASEAEGKRVIEHAASISGVTLTPDNYVVSTSKSSRVGQPGTMRIQQRRGLWMVANRQGPIGPPTYPAA